MSIQSYRLLLSTSTIYSVSFICQKKAKKTFPSELNVPEMNDEYYHVKIVMLSQLYVFSYILLYSDTICYREIRPLRTFNFVNVYDISPLQHFSKTFTCSSKVTSPNIRKVLANVT